MLFVMCEEETLIENMRTAWSAGRKGTIGTPMELSPAVMETSRPSSTAQHDDGQESQKVISLIAYREDQ